MSLLLDDIKVNSCPKVNRHLGAQVEARLDWVSMVAATADATASELKARQDFVRRVYGDIEWLFRKYAERVEQHAASAETPGFRALREDILKRLRGEGPDRTPFQNHNKPARAEADEGAKVGAAVLPD